nr:type 1 glutamine amidotransferase [Synechococcus elongatus]
MSITPAMQRLLTTLLMPPMRIEIVQHIDFEGAAAIAPWLIERGHTLSTTLLTVGDPLPDWRDRDAAILMGGPMNVDQTEEYPWLLTEKQWLKTAIAANKTLVGICLGAQLLAQALGATVALGPEPEIGWFPIQFSAQAQAIAGIPPELMAFHWHGDQFSLPPAAIPLAQSAVCPQQGFLWGDRILGLQCHLEMTPDALATITQAAAADLRPAPFIQSAVQILAGSDRCPSNHAVLFALLTHLGF